MEAILQRIKDLKSEKKLTNERLAEMAGIPLGTLSKVLAGFSDSIKVSTLLRICDALECSLEYLVTGEPENTNNYTLDAGEIRLIEDYRRLDSHGREMMILVLGKECERVAGEEYKAGTSIDREGIIRGRGKQYATASGATRASKRSIPLFDMPVSAGPGEYLDNAGSERISIPRVSATDDADYALRVSGNSMEPKYHDGDIILVSDTDTVEVGDLCIYILDGNGYFKRFGGDCLISLNPEYGNILLKDFAEVSCAGRVIGRLKKR